MPIMCRTKITTELRERLGAVSVGEAGRVPVALAGGGAIRTRSLHEWFGGDPIDRSHETMPLHIVVDALRRLRERGLIEHVLWVGLRSRPFPAFLSVCSGLLDRTVFVACASVHERLWVMDVALRSKVAVAVVGDGHGLRLAQSRRLQLAAQAGRGVCLLLRPAWEMPELSAATTRWGVRAAPSSTFRPRWTVSRLRDKHHLGATDDEREATVEWDHEKSCLRLLPVLADGQAAERAYA